MRNWKSVAVVIMGLVLLSCCGCTKQPEQKPQVLPVSVQADLVTKAAVEDILKSNPTMVIPGTKNEYLIEVREPDPNIDYTIMNVKPDPNTEYTILFANPKTNHKTIGINPETQNARKELLKRLKRKRKTIVISPETQDASKDMLQGFKPAN
jgi:hypothetical protein